MKRLFHSRHTRRVARAAVAALFGLAAWGLIAVYFARHEADVPHVFPNGADMVIGFADYEAFCRNLRTHFPGSSDPSCLLSAVITGIVLGAETALHHENGKVLFPSDSGMVFLSRMDSHWGIGFAAPSRDRLWSSWVRNSRGSQGFDLESLKDHYYVHENDDMVFISRSREWLRAVREHPVSLPPEHRRLQNTQLLLLGPGASHPFHLVITAAPEVPLEGWIGGSGYGDNVPLTLTHIFSGTPVLVSGGSGPLLQPILHWIHSQTERLLPPVLFRAVHEIRDTWLSAASASGTATAEVPFTPRQWAFALEGFDMEGPFPTPLVSAAFGRDRNVPPLSRNIQEFLGNAVPYTWSNGWSGLMSPLFGHRLYLCLAEKEGYTLMSSQEEAMQRLVRNFSTGKYSNALFLVRCHWRAAAETLLLFLDYAARLEMLPGYGVHDLQERLFPLVEGWKSEAWASISGTAGENGILLRGALFEGAG